MTPRVRRHNTILLSLAVLLTVLTVAVYFNRLHGARQPTKNAVLELRVADKDGRMRIDWDANNPLVASSHGATLEVEDGEAVNRYPVEPDILKSGGLDYVRRSEDVLLTLTLFQKNAPGVQSSVRRISRVDVPRAAQSKPRGRQSRARRR